MLSSQRRKAFTLVELLVVIAIIGVLIALLLPAIQAAREAARRSQCNNNLKQVATAVLNYESARKEIPAGANYEARGSLTGRTDWRRWVVSVLPYLEQGNVYQQIDPKAHFNVRLSIPATNGAMRNNQLAAETIIPTLICPSDPQAASPILDGRVNSGDNPEVCQGLWYKGSIGPTIPDNCPFVSLSMSSAEAAMVCMGSNYGTDFVNPNTQEQSCMAPCYKTTSTLRCPDEKPCVGMICRSRHAVPLKQVSDGQSNTLLLGETLPAHSKYNCIFCENMNVGSTHVPLNTMEDENGTPASTHPRAGGFKSLHPGGVHFAFADGSVHWIPEDADYFVVNALGSKAAAETVSTADAF